MPRCQLVCAVLLLVAVSAQAAVLRVEKDGSGDFVEIRDAVNAAATGDTIRIGPGRFDDFQYVHPGGWFIARVIEKSLTFEGSEAGATIIGPDEFGEPASSGVVGIQVLGEGETTRIRNIEFENFAGYAIRVAYSGRCEVDGCVFRGNYNGVFGCFGYGGWVRDCQFIDSSEHAGLPAVLFNAPSVGAFVENCEFRNTVSGVGSFWGGCDDITIRDSSFDGGEVGIEFVDGASGSIVGCTIRNMGLAGIIGQSAGTVRIEDNVVEQTGDEGCCFGTYYAPGYFYLRNNVFSAENVVLKVLQPAISLDARDNHFLRASEDAWYFRPYQDHWYSGPVVHLDFTGNWWGTDDPSLVAQWIWDRNDDPLERMIVDYLPMLGGPVRTERLSWGDLKSTFR